MNFLRHHVIIMAVAAAASIGIVVFAVSGISKPKNLDGVSVSRMTLQEEVRADGEVKPAEAIDLAFERGGKIVQVKAQTGDKVSAGQTIVILDSYDLSAQLAQAESDVKIQQARLDELKRGSRTEDVENQNISIQNAQAALADASQGMVDKLQDAYTRADDAVRSKADQMFSNPQTSAAQIIYTANDPQFKTDIEFSRTQIEESLREWKSSLDVLTLNNNFSNPLRIAKENLQQIKTFLDSLSLSINNPNSCLLDTKGSCQPISSIWKADAATARTNINTALSNLTLAESALNNTKANLALAKQGLTIKEAGTAPEQIDAQAAQLERAKAAKALVQAQFAKTVLRSPIDGVISRQDGKVGEIAPTNVPIVSIISEAKYQAEVFVSEIEVAKIKEGQTAKVTLDAYGDSDVFEAAVIKIDPAATSVNGVDSYKVTLQFTEEDARIKDGMGANVKITTAVRENVLAVPASAIIVRGQDKLVQVVGARNSAADRKVETGITGDNDFVEIVSGLSEGDQVIAFGGNK